MYIHKQKMFVSVKDKMWFALGFAMGSVFVMGFLALAMKYNA